MFIKKLSSASTILSFALFALAIPLPLHSERILEVSGTLAAVDYDAKGKDYHHVDTEFTASVSAHRWSIRADYGPNHYSVYACDGTNVYSYLFDHRTKVHTYLPGTVVRGQYPSDSTWYVTLPWLVYASADWLQQHVAKDGTASLPAIWAIPLGDPLALVYNCKLSINSEEPRTPTAVDFVVDPARLNRVRDGAFEILGSVPENQRDAWLLTARAYQANSTEARFRVLTFTNIDGSRLAARFELRRYDIMQTNTQDQRLVSLITGSLMAANGHEGNIGLPKADMPIFVNDFRFNNKADHIDAVKYPITNSAWKAFDLPEMAELYKRALANRPRKTSASTMKGLKAAAFLLVVVAIPLLVMRRAIKIRSDRQRQLGTGAISS